MEERAGHFAEPITRYNTAQCTIAPGYYRRRSKVVTDAAGFRCAPQRRRSQFSGGSPRESLASPSSPWRRRLKPPLFCDEKPVEGTNFPASPASSTCPAFESNSRAHRTFANRLLREYSRIINKRICLDKKKRYIHLY